MASTTKTICVLGGGVSGIITARELRKHFGTRHRIVVIDRTETHQFPPSFLWITLGWRKPEVIQKPRALLEKYGIEFHQSTISSIDTSRSLVQTDLAKIPYDYCVIALGAETVPRPDPGTEMGFQSAAEALRLREAISTFRNGTIAIVVREVPHVWPPAPYEAAFLLQAWFQQRSIGKVTFRILTPENQPLSFAGQSASAALRGMIEQRGIQLHTGYKTSGVRADAGRIEFEGKPSEPFDLLIGIPGTRPPAVLRTTNLADESGWIPVNERTLRTKDPRVFVVGDCAAIPAGQGTTLPKTAVFAFTQAEIVSHHIYHLIRKTPPTKEFSANSFCFIETGNGRACMLHGNFLPESEPSLILNPPSVASHWGKVVAEKYWLWRWM